MEILYLVLVFLLAPSLCQQQQQQQHSQKQKQHDDSAEHYHGQDGHYHHSNDGRGWDIRLSVPGEPEVDYPTLNVIPPTSFNCVGRDNGYFADVEARCQVFRVCTTTGPSGFYSFLCPNGTLFNQDLHVCDWWMNVNCAGIDSELLSIGRVQARPGSGMLQEIKKMIMYPMNNPLPPNYPANRMTTQVYNPPSDMMSLFVSPPQDIEGQQILGEVTVPNSLTNPNKFTTSIKHDSFTSGTTGFSNNPIVVNEFQATVANTPTVQEDLNSKFIQQQAEILNLQKQFNSNTQQQSIKITKQQFTYPSQFDKQYTVTVPKIPTPLNQPFVVNIPINIPAIDGNDNLVSEQMVSDETNNRNPFNKYNNSSSQYHPTATVASIPFVILLLKPTEQNHNHLTETQSEDIILTNPSNNNFYNDHQNFVPSTESRENAYTNSINYFYPHGYIDPSASYTKNPSNSYIPTTKDVNNYYENDAQNNVDGSLGDQMTVSEYKETTIDLDNAKDFQMSETEKDLIMEQLNKHLDKQEEGMSNEIMSIINTTNTNADNNLVTIFSAHVIPKGDEANEKVLKLCVPKDALIYLLKVHNATKQALERHSQNYKFSSHDNSNHQHHHSNEEMVNMLMQNVLMKDVDYSDQQVPIVNDAELFRNQQFVSFQNHGSAFRNTNRKVIDSVTTNRQNQEVSYQSVPFVAGNAQSDLQSNVKYQTSVQNQGSVVNKNFNQQSGVTTNRFSAKFNKNQLNQFSGGQKGAGQDVQTSVVNNGPVLGTTPQDENYDQYRITSSVDGPKTIVDEENRGEFFSLQHFGVRQQQSRPHTNAGQNGGNKGNSQQDINSQGQQVITENLNTNQNTINGINTANLQFTQNTQQTQPLNNRNQIKRVQSNDVQILSGFAGLQKPTPFARTPNSPPQKNDNNRILNHNMAGFINNQPLIDVRSQFNKEEKQTNNVPVSNGSQNNLNSNGQQQSYSYTQEYTKTTGPIVTGYNQQQITQFVQSTPGVSQQSHYSFTGQQNAIPDSNVNKNLPVVTKVTVGRKEDAATSSHISPTPAVNSQYYETSSYQGANFGSNGGYTQSVTQTKTTPSIAYQQNTKQIQTNGNSQKNGFNSQTNTQGYNQGSQNVAQGSRASQNVGNTNSNKYDQVLTIQKQLGGSNVPTPFTKTGNGYKQNKLQTSLAQSGQYDAQSIKADVQFVNRHNYNKNLIGQTQFSNQQFSNPNVANNGQIDTNTQKIADRKNQITRVGTQFVTSNKQFSGGNGQFIANTNQNQIGQVNRGGQFSNTKQIGGETEEVTGNVNKLNGIATQFITSNNQFAGNVNKGNAVGTQIVTSDNRFAGNVNNGNGVGTQFVKTNNQFTGNVNKGNGVANQFVTSQLGSGQVQIKQTIGQNVQNQGNNNFVQANTVNRGSSNTGTNVQSTIGVQSNVNRVQYDQKNAVQNQQSSSKQGGFQVQANVAPKVSTVGTKTQFVGIQNEGSPDTQNLVTRVQVVPAFGFAIDSDRERDYYFSALSRGLKDVEKIYIPPYDEATADFMISEINRQAQLGQFTPSTFEAMYNALNSAPSIGVQAMLNGNFGPGIQSSFGLQFAGKDTAQTITNGQQISSINDANIHHQSISVDNLGYPKEKPRIAFTF